MERWYFFSNTMTLLPLIILSLMALGPLWKTKYLPKRRIQRWKRALNLDQHYSVFSKIYATINGFELSQEARKNGDAIEFVYGEIDFDSFIALLTLCRPNSNTIFYDLGSGTGKAVLACAMVFNISKSYGLELLPALHKCAKRQQQQLSMVSGYKDVSQSIHFWQGDFLQLDISNANLVFINSSAFFGEFWEKTSRHIEQVAIGTLVISTSKALASQQFKLLRKVPVKMSWGVVPAFIQQRLPDARK